MVTLDKMCRTVNGADINFIDEYKKNVTAFLEERFDDIDKTIFSAVQKDGRGNICPVTIIMPTLAMEAQETTARQLENGAIKEENFEEYHINNFFKLLLKKIEEAKDTLIERYDYITS